MCGNVYKCCTLIIILLYYYFNILAFLASINKTSLTMNSFVITAAEISWGTFKCVPLTTGGMESRKWRTKPAFFMQKITKCLSITSYSWENFKLSFAFRRSMWSASSMTGMGGWLAIPADRRQTKSPGVSASTPEPTPRDGHHRGWGMWGLFGLYDWSKQPHALREWIQKPHRAFLMKRGMLFVRKR